jgi:cytochrome c
MTSLASAADPDGASLAEKNRCAACHDLTRTLIGPSYEAIAARHSANKELMVEVLAQKIIVGGAGNWGVVPMVPNEHVSLEEARAISRWILNLQ